MPKSTITKRILIYQSIGYGILLFLIVGDELFDFPYHVFGAPATPINWHEVAIEAMYIIGLYVFTMYLSVRFLNRIKHLEGFLAVCSFCKRIRVDEAWMQLDHYIITHSEAEVSHSLCPECAEKHYGEFLAKVRKSADKK